MSEKIAKFTVIGMGQTGHALTGYLMGKGQIVTCWDRNQEKLKHLERYGLQITGLVEGEYRPAVKADIARSVLDAEYIMVMTTADGHRDIADLLRGKLQKGQRIIIFNGNWGAYDFYKILRTELADKGVLLAETGGQLLISIIRETGRVHLKAIKKNVALASLPVNGCSKLLEELKDVLPQFRGVANVLETSLNNSNAVIHTPLNMFNLARVENHEEYFMYAANSEGREYMTPLSVAYMEKVDAERLSVMGAIGLRGTSVLDTINSFWNSSYTDLFEALRGVRSYQTAKSPISLDHRHFSEDLPFGIIPILKLAKLYGIEVPYIENMVLNYKLCIGLQSLPQIPEFEDSAINELKL